MHPVHDETVSDEPMTSSIGPAEVPRSAQQIRLYLLVGGLLVALAALATTTILFGVRANHLQQATSARTQALAAARADAVVIASYDYRKLDAYFNSVKTIATGSFAKQYTKANTTLRGILTQSKAVVKAKVIGAGVESSTDRRAVVVLFVDQSVVNASGAPQTDRSRMLMTLQKSAGRWMVSDLALQ